MLNTAAQDRGSLALFQQTKSFQPGRDFVAQLRGRDEDQTTVLPTQRHWCAKLVCDCGRPFGARHD